MARDVPLMHQTVYAELLDRCLSADFGEAFSESGTFVSKEIRGRRYWYFQESGTKKQRYVGPENAALLERISRHRQIKGSEHERRALVSTLVRSANLPRPLPEIGSALAAMAGAGVFRLRGVLVGTVAFQTYSASLGVRLPPSAMGTLDIDIAQDRNVSIAVNDSVQGLLDALRGADPTFHAVPPKPGSDGSWAYKTGKGDIRVEFLTPNRGRDSDAAVHLPALDTYAQQLRFLDYLIRDSQPAVVLHGAGVLVNVPAPERYCFHKLIVARRRSALSGKIGKDIEQAQSLLLVLARSRPDDLRNAWSEVEGRGAKWRRLVLEGLGQVDPLARDETLKVLGLQRDSVPNLTIELSAVGASYHPPSDTLKAIATSKGLRVTCVIEGDALARFSSKPVNTVQDRIVAIRERTGAFERHFRAIQEAVQAKYLRGPIDSSDVVRITAADIDSANKRAKS
ncbi:MAG: hypothetical protein IT562_12580 [Alphaproteobacteria bacterium]|nr:hypothetical protein [Alphaproteobacteria bacterium]